MKSTLEMKQRQRQEHIDDVNMMKVGINSITTETLRLSAKLQKREKLESEMVEFNTTIRTFQREIEVMRTELLLIFPMYSCNHRPMELVYVWGGIHNFGPFCLNPCQPWISRSARGGGGGGGCWGTLFLFFLPTHQKFFAHLFHYWGKGAWDPTNPNKMD